MRLYHVRSVSGTPNLEGICTDSYYSGWNPERSSGSLGTGLYCYASPPQITKHARLYVYEIDVTKFFRVQSIAHEGVLTRLSKTLMNFVVASLRATYGTAKQAPLRAWYDHCDETVDQKELIAISEELAAFDDTLSRFLKDAAKDSDWYLFDFVTSYARYVREGASLTTLCESRQTPLTFLLIQLGYTGLLYDGDAGFLNDRTSHGVVLFDTDAVPLSMTNVDPGWVSSYRSALLSSSCDMTMSWRLEWTTI